jgi:pyruvate kinase
MSHNPRNTKIVCTIGPKTATKEMLLALAHGGMNIARLNFSHGTHEWHGSIIDLVHQINAENDLHIGVMLDTKGPEIRSGDIAKPIALKKGDTLTFTITKQIDYPQNTVAVNYDGFVDDVAVGDIILVDSGIMHLHIIEKTDTDIICEVLEEGTLTSRRHLNIRGKSANLPALTEKDWEDIDFGIEKNVDFFALSFVNDAPVVTKLRQYLEEKGSHAHIMSKIESVDGVKNIEAIVAVSDAIMVARGDLGAELPVEDVPMVETDIVALCRETGTPVVVATQLLESMMVNPTPTRAEVTDMFYAVSLQTDAIMMSGETANGNYPLKALETMQIVALKTESTQKLDKTVSVEADSTDVKFEITVGAAVIANNIEAQGLVIFSKTGQTATLMSQCRPNAPQYVFVPTHEHARRASVLWGVRPRVLEFDESNPESSIHAAIDMLKKEGACMFGDKLVVVSHLLAGNESVHGVQVREVK